jgi:hypothetical protein
MKALWLAVQTDSLAEPSSVEFEMSLDGQKFIFWEANHPPQGMSVQMWGANIKVIFQQFTTSVNDLFPAGITCDGFNLTTLSDDFRRRESIFLRPQNHGLINGIINKIVAQLLTPGECRHKLVSLSSSRINQASVDAWFSKEAKACRLGLISKSLSCGIPLRSFQYQKLLYHSQEGEEARNVFLDDGLVVVGCPVAKQLNLNRNSSFWGLAPRMANTFLCLIGIIKLVGQRILAKAGKIVPFYDTEIFVHYKPRSRKILPFQFNGNDSDAAIGEFSSKPFGMVVTSRLLRQMTKAVFRSQLPQLFGAAFRVSTGSNNALASRLSRFDNLPVSLDHLKGQASFQIEVSRIWQALHRLGPADTEWQDILQENHILPSEKYDNIAWEYARALINSEYGVGGRDSEAIANTVKSLLDRKPFLNGDKVCMIFLIITKFSRLHCMCNRLIHTTV